MPDISNLDISNPLVLLLIAAGVFLIIAKVMKVEKTATVICVCAVIAWLALHFSGYEERFYNMIFNALPIQGAQPKHLLPK